MTDLTDLTGPAAASGTHDRLATVVLGLGVVAGLLTTVLAFVSLVSGVLTLVLGGVTLARRGAVTRASVGMAMAAVSVYVIVLEIFVVG